MYYNIIRVQMMPFDNVHKDIKCIPCIKISDSTRFLKIQLSNKKQFFF